ncbi:uncharacterized protein [Leptinotarsa decemlineata]|uniref:uncharacterized protein n=1 Tax=Leptinotarsa decemlineata TaxID=7539 RepID=UPI000C252FF8|nr:uncharacterized protein LOC111517367 [Leptinotarsa decemlineata]
MEKTPVQKSKWLNKQGICKQNNAFEEVKVSSSPKHQDIDNDSPLQIPLTQDASENVDVVWDWNSPQQKPHPRKSQKRLILPPSPKIPIKRHPSHNSIQNFEKLRSELQALREEIAVPENEDFLRLSPVEEADYKNISNTNSLEEEFQNDNFEDLFNSPVNTELMKFCDNGNEIVSSNTNVKQDGVKSPSRSPFKKVQRNSDISKNANDSFEALLSEVDIDQLTYSNEKGSENSKKCEESNSFAFQKYNLHKSTGKVEFFRTKSFELSNVEHITGIPKEQMDDIERKRREALAKLNSKRKQDLTVISPTSQCSLEEIENKRRQALAKLEAKREQEIIERKRQEALKRLQSRKRNAPNVKSVLTKRLDYEIT